MIYEYFGEGDRWYLVMSFIQGGSLQSYLDAAPGNKMPVQEVVRIGIELCNVLEYLHTHQPQIIFRDLKPLNIMITPKGQIYLIDFGIARHFKQEQTKDTVYYYSVGYAPPEQYGQSQTSPRSDLYSLGATLHQMLSGHNPASKPFHFPSLQLLDPMIPVPLAQLITQMLELDEQQRPVSAAMVKAELEKLLKPGPVEEPRKEVIEKKEKSKDEQIDLQQDAIKKSGRTWQQSWDGINRFFGKWRIIAWISFMLLSALLGIWGSQIVQNYIMNIDQTYPTPGYWFAVVGIGAALVGLAFLVANGRFIVDILGGITFTVLGDILLFYIAYNYVFPPLPVYASVSTLPLLLLGARFFVRSANTILGSVVGTLMIIAGIILLNYTLFPVQFNYGNPLYIMSLWVLQILLGIVVIVITIRKGRRTKQSAQIPAA